MQHGAQDKFRSVSGNVNLNHTMLYPSVTLQTVNIITDTLRL